tara:strand:- start:554 stop:1585 length:1032 start_codon:yes stop_codon:yes gene_type:complete
MSFFDKKEEIIEIQLTSYGKFLLSKALWKPKYYCFFDTDVLYDSEYANFSESSGDSEERIQENTPSMRALTSFDDLEMKARKHMPDPYNFEYIVYDENIFDEENNAASFMLPIGNSDIANQKVPAWDVRFLKNGSLTASYTSDQYEDTDISPVINIPNLVCNMTASITCKKASFCGNINPENGKYVHVYPDKTFFHVDDDFILLDITEHHAPLSNDAFTVEVYEKIVNKEYNEDGVLISSETILAPKLFKKKVDFVQNGFLLEENEIEAQMKNAAKEPNENYVEYWFDIQVDNSIDNHTKCNYISSLEKRNNIFDNTVGCEVYEQSPGMQMYKPEDFEPEDCG